MTNGLDNADHIPKNKPPRTWFRKTINSLELSIDLPPSATAVRVTIRKSLRNRGRTAVEILGARATVAPLTTSKHSVKNSSRECDNLPKNTASSIDVQKTEVNNRRRGGRKRRR